jgi:hypothetical protein
MLPRSRSEYISVLGIRLESSLKFRGGEDVSEYGIRCGPKLHEEGLGWELVIRPQVSTPLNRHAGLITSLVPSKSKGLPTVISIRQCALPWGCPLSVSYPLRYCRCLPGAVPGVEIHDDHLQPHDNPLPLGCGGVGRLDQQLHLPRYILG